MSHNGPISCLVNRCKTSNLSADEWQQKRLIEVARETVDFFTIPQKICDFPPLYYSLGITPLWSWWKCRGIWREEMSSAVSFGGPWNATSSPRGSTEGKFSPPYVPLLEWLISKVTKNRTNVSLKYSQPIYQICLPSPIFHEMYKFPEWTVLLVRELVGQFPESAWYNLTFTKTLTMCLFL